MNFIEQIKALSFVNRNIIYIEDGEITPHQRLILYQSVLKKLEPLMIHLQKTPKLYGDEIEYKEWEDWLKELDKHLQGKGEPMDCYPRGTLDRELEEYIQKRDELHKRKNVCIKLTDAKDLKLPIPYTHKTKWNKGQKVSTTAFLDSELMGFAKKLDKVLDAQKDCPSTYKEPGSQMPQKETEK